MNFSFVLHEPSDSPAVKALAARVHGLRFRENAPAVASDTGGGDVDARVPPDRLNDVIGGDALADSPCDAVLTAHLGVPSLLGRIVDRLPVPSVMHAIDAATGPFEEADFFRAPARLSLPALLPRRVRAAVVVVRPGGKTVELVCAPARAWPEERSAAIRDLERMILAYVDQWHPPTALWPYPAEVLLPEVTPGSAGGS